MGPGAGAAVAAWAPDHDPEGPSLSAIPPRVLFPGSRVPTFALCCELRSTCGQFGRPPPRVKSVWGVCGRWTQLDMKRGSSPRPGWSTGRGVSRDGHPAPGLASPRPGKDAASSHGNGISLTRLSSPSLRVSLSFPTETFYPHSLTLHKRASSASRAAAALPLQGCRARFEGTAPLSASAPRGLARGPTQQ